MRVSLAWRWVGPLFASLLAITGLIVVAPCEVHAGCDHQAALLAHFDHLAASGAIALVPRPTDAPKPCAGPMCSKLPAVPPGPTALPATIEPWAILTDRLAFVLPAAPPFPAETTRAAGEHHVPSIFHPPRPRR